MSDTNTGNETNTQDPPRRRRDPNAKKDPAVPDRTTTPRSAPRPARRGPEPVVQLNVRVNPLVSELVQEVCADRGWSQRQAIEFAVSKAFAAELESLQARKQAS